MHLGGDAVQESARLRARTPAVRDLEGSAGYAPGYLATLLGWIEAHARR